jgi:hypothetical protein
MFLLQLEHKTDSALVVCKNRNAMLVLESEVPSRALAVSLASSLFRFDTSLFSNRDRLDVVALSDDKVAASVAILLQARRNTRQSLGLVAHLSFSRLILTHSTQ